MDGGSLVHEPALSAASGIDKSFLLAMAKDDEPSKMFNIQERLDVDANYASRYRLRLLVAELIEPTGHGYVDFAILYLREYLAITRRQTCDKSADDTRYATPYRISTKGQHVTVDIIPFPSHRDDDSTALDARITPKLAGRLAEIEDTIVAFCRAMLDDEYERLCVDAFEDVRVIAPDTFARGRTDIWAGGIIHMVGQRNNLFHAWFGPQLAASEIARLLEASQPSISSKSKQLRELLELGPVTNDNRYLRSNSPAHMRDMIGDLAPLLTGVLYDDDKANGLPFDIAIEPEQSISISERVEMLHQMADSLSGLPDDLLPEASMRTELVARLQEHAARLDDLATRSIDDLSVDAASEDAGAALMEGHALIVRTSVVAVLGAERADALGETAVLVGELAMCGLEDVVALHDEDVLHDVQWQRDASRRLMHLIASGHDWGQRNARPTRTTKDDLLEALGSELRELDLIESFSLGLTSPLALVVSNALEHVGERWNDSLSIADADLLEDAAHRADNAVDGDLTDRDLFTDWFEVGIALALSLRVIDENADTADGIVRPTALDPTHWIEVLQGEMTMLPHASSRSLAKPRYATATPMTYRIKVTLRGTKPPIWRRVEIDGDITLDQLHVVLQAAMGWQDAHLHAFEIDHVRYMRPDPHAWGDSDDDVDTSAARLCDVATQGSKFRYDYDFGDSWEHAIVVEAVEPRAANAATPRPALLAGRRACPPEDCGGVWGFEHLLAALDDAEHADHDDLMEWTDGGFDPAAFTTDGFNDALAWHGWRD